MVNFFRLSKYFLAYIIILIISAAIAVGGLLRPVDLMVYKKFYLNSQIEKSNSRIKDKIIFVNVPVNDPNGNFLGVEFLRGQIANLLDTIGKTANRTNEPPIVILDMTFSNNPLALDSIKDAVIRLKQEKIKVYASYELPLKGDPASFQNHDAFQAKALYDDDILTGGRLNTKFNTHGEGLLSYDSFELIGQTPIPSLPVKVVHDYKRESLDLTDSIRYPLPIRLPFDQSNFQENTYVFVNDTIPAEGQRFSSSNASIDLSDKFIVVGLSDDIQDIDGDQIPGPFLVAAALIDQLNGNEFTRPSHDDIVVQLAMVLMFALFVCLIFAVFYKYVKRLQTKPHFIAVLSFVIGLMLLAGFGYAMSKYTIIRPALPLLSMIWASVLAWHFTRKFLVTGIMEGGEVFDVFISYSHGDSAWVKPNLFTPLSEIKKPDGSKLSIFFDEKSIGIGELFTSRYMRAIVDSKFFVPVMSEEYYKKNHCRNEMDLAVKRHVEKLIGLCIIAFDSNYVPPEFTNINYVDKNSNFIDILKKELTKVEDDKLEQQPDTEHNIELKEEDVKPINTTNIDEKAEVVEQDSDKKEKKAKDKAKKKVKKNKKEDKKKDKKRSDKKDKKDKKKKEKKTSKKDSKKKNKKESKKKDKKRSDKKDKKDRKKNDNKKSKKGSDKNDKKKGKKKSKKS